MTHPEYLLAGHSHIFSMGAPPDYQGPLDLIKTDDGQGYIVMEQWSGGRSNEYWDKVVHESQGRDVMISFNGNQHHGSFLFAPASSFDFFDESTPEIMEGATVVPKRLVQSYFEPSLKQLRELLPRMLAAGCRSIRLIGSPPPKSDIHAFAHLIRASSFAQVFAQRNGIDLDEAKISPAPLLLKLWRVIQELTAAVAVDDRLAFVPVPTVAADSRGFLAKQFYDYVPSDITHANRAFGRLMLDCALASTRN
jgi:hypothetical protein